MKLNVSQAALGATITVPTVEGDEQLPIPPGTQSGKIIRLRGKGFPKLNSPGQRGDQLVVVQVVVPTRLTAEQKQLFEQLGHTLGAADAELQRAAKGFFHRLLEF